MSGAPAPDRGAIAFAEKLMTVLAYYGRKTATYKYAVLLGLIDLVTSSPRAPKPRRGDSGRFSSP